MHVPFAASMFAFAGYFYTPFRRGAAA